MDCIVAWQRQGVVLKRICKFQLGLVKARTSSKHPWYSNCQKFVSIQYLIVNPLI